MGRRVAARTRLPRVVELTAAVLSPGAIALIVAAAAVLIAALVVVVRIFTDKQQE